MHRSKAGLLSFGVIVGLGALSACGTSSSGGPSGGGGTGLAGCHGTITVATDLPLTGGDSTDGPYPEHGAHLAVTQANTAKTLGGCTLNYVSKDDSSVAKGKHDPAQGAANITALAADTSVVGVVGPFNSSVALAEIPVATMNHLALISPSNTNPCLTIVVALCSDATIGIDTASLYKGPHTYFRVIASDVQQGEILAYIASHEKMYTKGYVIDDGEAYGRGVALLFSKYFTAAGGTVVNGTSASLPSGTTTYATQVSDAQSKGAQFIFFGGTTSGGCGILRRDMAAGGLSSTPLLGADGCQDTKFVTDANSGSSSTAAEGTEATSAPDVSKLSSSATFFMQYAQAYASDPTYSDGTKEPYTAYGYDAMNILIQAIKSVLVANNGQPLSDSNAFRDAVVAQLHNVQYDGALGHTSFDTNGDTTNTGFTLYKVTGGSFAAEKTYAVDPSGTVTPKS
jgi:branched-chain amino acid transport system substrate-binding protein